MTVRILMVPIHLDALVMPATGCVVEPTADFRRLPYFNGQGDVNSGVPYLSEVILSQPFEDQNLRLPPGIHLHWTLPDVLSRGVSDGKAVRFPRVPNRWLVRRAARDLPERNWVIESDFLSRTIPAGQDSEFATTYPHPIDPKQPYRFIGRRRSLEEWLRPESHTPDDEYLDPEKNPLTVMGYGEPSFAAFYPNCASVFGMYDAEYATSREGLTYEVVGWYGNPKHDPLHELLPEFQPGVQLSEWYKKVKEKLRWDLVENDKRAGAEITPVPSLLVCFGRVTFGAEISAPPTTTKITVGNTPSQALAACIASLVDETNRQSIQEQLEAILLGQELQQSQVDQAFNFISLRHERSFTAVGGGTLWTLRPDSRPAAGTSQANAPQSLPDELATALDKLNQTQAKLHGEHEEIHSLRKQLFSDWIRYMVCSYPPDGNALDLPDPDAAGEFVEQRSLQMRTRLNKVQTTLAELKAAHSRVEQMLADLVSLRADDIIDTQKIQDALHKLDEARRTPAALTAPQQFLADLLPRMSEPLRTRLRGAQSLSGDDIAGLIKTLQKPLVDASDSARPGHKIQERRRVKRLIEDAFPGAILDQAVYHLQKIPAPRCWLPNEPVVLIAGEGVRQSDRFRTHDTLRCPVITSSAETIPGAFETLLGQLAFAPEEAADSPVRTGIRTRQRQPWHPFLLEWSVALHPAPGGQLIQSGRDSYSRDFIARNYSLTESAVDFAPINAHCDAATSVYQGRTILTAHAERHLKQQLAHFLAQSLPPDLRSRVEPQSTSPEELQKYIHAHITELRRDYENQAGAGKRSTLDNANDAVYSALRGYERLTTTPSLAQALSGFNQALLMHKQTMQLPIADPIGFAEARAITDAVKQAIGNGLTAAPQPSNDFNPIRSGYLEMQDLRLVDSFGQVLRLPLQGRSRIPQTPRLAQPARLNFRWLSARLTREDGCTALEMSAHPATTPICGWLLPNLLDNSLSVYDASGDFLGVINTSGNWDIAPGEPPRTVDQIPNPHLKRVVRELLDQAHSSEASWQDFLVSVSDALENIEPAAQAHHEATALLMGRPLAVVRAALDLQLKGLPSNKQDWNLFRKEMESSKDARLDGGLRDACGFTQVEFPIRVGESRRLHDGVVGFWEEIPPAGAGGSYSLRRGFHLNDAVLKLSVDAPPPTLTMLIDPRGAVHATCGIQPVKSIQIPSEMYAEALRRIEVTFLSTPILTRTGAIELPLPVESGYRWSFLEMIDNVWKELPTGASPSLGAEFVPLEVREGWLKLNSNE